LPAGLARPRSGRLGVPFPILGTPKIAEYIVGVKASIASADIASAILASDRYAMRGMAVHPEDGGARRVTGPGRSNEREGTVACPGHRVRTAWPFAGQASFKRRDE